MHVTIVGAGLAGLATAVHLARAGCAVTVLEAAPAPGGRARSTVRDGHVLNLGPHALYPDAVAALAELGVRPSMRRPIVPVALSWRGALVSPLHLGRLAPWLAGLALRDAGALAGIPVGDWLDDELSGPARALAGALARVACYTERVDVDAGVALRQLRLAARGVRYVDGGWQAIVDGLVAVAREAGVTIRTGAAAHALEGARVRLDDGAVDGDLVVVAAADRARAVLPELPPLEAARASCLDVALHRLPRRSPGFVVGVDEPLYCSVHSLTAALGPGAVVHVAGYGDVSRERLEALLDQTQPGWRDEVAHARFLPRMTVIEGLPVVGAPRPALRPRPGVILAGEAVGDGLLAAATLDGARRAAEAALGAAEMAA